MKENHSQNRKTQFPSVKRLALGRHSISAPKNGKFKETTFPTLSYFLHNTGQGLLYTSRPWEDQNKCPWKRFMSCEEQHNLKEYHFIRDRHIFAIERILCNCFLEGKGLDGGSNSPGFEFHLGYLSCCQSVSFISDRS